MTSATHSSAELPRYQPRTVEERAEQTRRAIVGAALEAFRTHGYEATTMGAIAALAGVSPRSLYRHYGSKGQLFAETVAMGSEDLLAYFAANLDRMPLREAILDAACGATVDANEQNRALLHLASTEREMSRFLHMTTQRMIPPLADILRTSAGVSIENAEPIVWETRATALIGALTCGFQYWAATPDSDVREQLSRAVDTVLPILQTASGNEESVR
ncbi:TetR/AcrR family transcriptional regulator [Nocardia sp. 348MFTsu5.1]|uniref:TetR/AcrR family transcriptional regulator n=1 Tax=Nocardia sp. 348MFTsu5.1 TaxID=1172185 RepID=UPI00037EBACB|nr:TetR/AcrR family transcriptional regulator [Nocardia sp. 348MFTsu5.1]